MHDVSIKRWHRVKPKVKPNLRFAALKLADFWVGFRLGIFWVFLCGGCCFLFGVFNFGGRGEESKK